MSRGGKYIGKKEKKRKTRRVVMVVFSARLKHQKKHYHAMGHRALTVSDVCQAVRSAALATASALLRRSLFGQTR